MYMHSSDTACWRKFPSYYRGNL